jgi:acetoin utilization deacetylase AcuC-like enzyme
MIIVTQEHGGSSVPFLCDSNGEPTLLARDTDARLLRIVEGLSEVQGCTVVSARAEHPRLDAILHTVHADEYLAFLAALEREPPAEPLLVHPFVTPDVTPDTPVIAGMYHAARAAACSVIDAVERQAAHGLAYAACRPPGHHAGPGWLGGYCFLNNAAIAVAALREQGHGRVAVLDIDFHFGNGTAAVLQRDMQALYVSLHCDTKQSYPYRSVTAAHERQVFLSFLEPPTHSAYLAALEVALTAIRDFGSEALVVSIGYDIVAGDPHGGWSLEPAIFREIGRMLNDGQRPLLFVQEGGYRLDALADCSRSLAQGVREAAGAAPPHDERFPRQAS